MFRRLRCGTDELAYCPPSISGIRDECSSARLVGVPIDPANVSSRYIGGINDQTHLDNPLQSKNLATGRTSESKLVDLPCPNKKASAKLPTRGMTTVEGIINDRPFRATLEPDGQRSHWLKVSERMRETVGAEAGDVVSLSEIQSVGTEPDPRVDLRKALAAAPEAHARADSGREATVGECS